ncbi:uncharacterized protein LOC120344087 [Styela clava]
MSTKKAKGKTKKVSQNDLRKMMNDMKNKRTIDVVKSNNQRDGRVLTSNPEAYKKALNDRMKLQALIAGNKSESTQKNTELIKSKTEYSGERVKFATKKKEPLNQLKRPLTAQTPNIDKKVRLENEPKSKVAKTVDLSVKDKKPGGLLIGDYGSDSEEDQDVTEKIEEKMETDEPNPEQQPSTSDTTLPEGFFDDPEVDAKIRGVETPADAMDREWEDFQKEIKRETDQSEHIVEEEQEVGNVDRQIEEIDEQIMHFSRVEKLNIVKEGIKKKAKEKNSDSESENDEETGSDELDELLDWREKDSHF